MLIGAAVILYYTSVGGFKAVAYSDLLQGILVFGGLLVLPIVEVVAAGGWGETMSQLQSQDPNLLLPMGELGLSTAGVILSLYGKLTTVVIGTGALVFALVEVRMIFWFVFSRGRVWRRPLPPSSSARSFGKGPPGPVLSLGCWPGF